MSAPRVSVLIASRDGERYLEASLASLAAQTLPDVEIVAVDDGSRDRTAAIFNRFASAHPRTRVLHTEGVGLAAALRQAAAHAAGECFARQDDDDLSEPARLERQVGFLDAHPGVGVVGTAAQIIDESGAARGSHPVPEGTAIARTLRRAPPFVHGSVMMRASVYRAAGGYRGAFRASQDFDLWLRLPRETGLANLSEPLYRWRLHPAGLFSRAREQQLRFAALARAFADERRLTGGGDSIAAFEHAGSFERFLETWERGPELALLLGEVFARDGRIVEARRYLARARRSPRTRGGALAWSLIAGAVAFTPRARRAAGTRGEGAGA